MSHNANCQGCAYFDPEHGCLNGVSWSDGPVPADAFCFAPVLFRHPDGAAMIFFDANRSRLVVENEQTGLAVCVPIGPRGLLELAQALIAQALKGGR